MAPEQFKELLLQSLSPATCHPRMPIMTAISELPPTDRAKRYRQLAQVARAQAKRSKGAPRLRSAYSSMAGRRDGLALEVEEAQYVSVFLEKAW
jgi:hypothetical protein